MAGVCWQNKKMARASKSDAEAGRKECPDEVFHVDSDKSIEPPDVCLWAALDELWPANMGEQQEEVDTLSALAQASCDPGAELFNGRALWEWAASRAFAPVLRAMSKAGVDVAALAGAQLERVACDAAMVELDPGGFSNLRWEESLILLLDLGWAPSDICHPAWRLALSNSAYYGRADRVDQLLERGVEPCAPVEGAPEPLWLAAIGADESGALARALLAAGADVDAMGEEGMTARGKALRMGRSAVAEAMRPWALSRREGEQLERMLSAGGESGRGAGSRL